MLARRLIVVLFALTLILLGLGGVVHTTGSSLACPDWPLCFGEVFPPMRGGILFEHSHRLLAAAVGLLTLIIATLTWQRPDPRLRILAALGVALVIFQGCLGGLTVLLRLPPIISVAHLATSMGFFAWTVVMTFYLRADGQRLAAPLAPRGPVALAASLVYVQLVLGALVRHSGASLTCGLQVLTCAGNLMPTTAPQWLQTTHRVLALGVAAAVIIATLGPMRAARRAGRPLVRQLGIFSHSLLLLQLAMGALTLTTGVQLHVVTTHLVLGALLWATLVAFYLAVGPLGTPVAPRRAAVPMPVGSDGLHGAR